MQTAPLVHITRFQIELKLYYYHLQANYTEFISVVFPVPQSPNNPIVNFGYDFFTMLTIASV